MEDVDAKIEKLLNRVTVIINSYNGFAALSMGVDEEPEGLIPDFKEIVECLEEVKKLRVK